VKSAALDHSLNTFAVSNQKTQMPQLSNRTFTDMLNRRIEINYPPKRIVSLVPSQTELLYHLGLEDEVVGITKFCIHPDTWFQSKKRIGGTKALNMAAIRALKPDLIIANKEENTQAEIETLAQEFPVWISDVKTVDDSIVLINSLGELVEKQHMSEMLVKIILDGFSKLKPFNSPKSALYLIWQKPWMSVNSDTFIHDMMVRCGFKNVCADFNNRYPELSAADILKLKPELILLSSEPFPFAEKHIDELASLFQNSRIGLVDGEAFSWYGSRMVESLPYFQQLIETLRIVSLPSN